jgi:hypothetical protein
MCRLLIMAKCTLNNKVSFRLQNLGKIWLNYYVANKL